jgi:hypothetical protein
MVVNDAPSIHASVVLVGAHAGGPCWPSGSARPRNSAIAIRANSRCFMGGGPRRCDVYAHARGCRSTDRYRRREASASGDRTRQRSRSDGACRRHITRSLDRGGLIASKPPGRGGQAVNAWRSHLCGRAKRNGSCSATCWRLLGIVVCRPATITAKALALGLGMVMIGVLVGRRTYSARRVIR